MEALKRIRIDDSGKPRNTPGVNDRIGSLENTSLEEIADAFNDAFSGYQVPVTMDADALSRLIRARSVRLDHSLGVFDGGRLTAFVLCGARYLNGVLTAYNAGTGVRARAQGNGLGTELMQTWMGGLRSHGYRRCLLEVLADNTPAIRLYERSGFSVLHELRCLRRSVGEYGSSGDSVTEGPVGTFLPAHFAHLRTFTPSWQNAAESINAVSATCRLVECLPEAGRAARPQAFCVLNTDSGSLMQLGWTTVEHLMRVLARAARLAEPSRLTVINVPAPDAEALRVLAACGFETFVSQVEMQADLE